MWQGLAGGGEEGETPIESAQREAFEEAGITRGFPYIELGSISSLPVEDISLSKDHLNNKWLCFEEAVTLLKWDSNKTALWELNKRLLNLINTKHMKENI
ncbi:NUDIX domain-containing protein [Enterococcus faecalis]|uniref:NUDIX domain-containing protein n=1 Tax=Enterococcus faecalis TaxID=1351 RepID=UPI003B004874